MTTWKDVVAAEPEFAKRVQALFDGGKHKTIATLRADGSPRISGIECEFGDELTFGSMGGARKLADLTRDGRFALHSPTISPVEGKEADWPGEAKISGVASPGDGTSGGPADAQSFRAEIREVSLTHLDPAATKLIVQWWTPTKGLQTVERA